MASDKSGGERHAAQVLRDNWYWLLLLGVVLVAAGLTAIVVPAISGATASKVLGGVLIVSGILQLLQSARTGNWVGNWLGFLWQTLLGVLATVGGVLIYLNPFAGVLALTILIAIVFAMHGVTQIAFSMRIRSQPGWHWFAISGGIALATAALLLLKLPYSRTFTPATVAGVSLLFAGWAYIAMALTARKAPGQP